MTSEAYTQSIVRIGAVRWGEKLWRNNVGVLIDKTGRPVRFGLANESKRLNEELKSSDLIGWKSVTVTPEMVGQKLAVFVSRECKRPGWTYRGDPHEAAQKTWLDMITLAGGDARFTTGEEYDYR
jgi:hypothetical protein